MLAKVDLTLTLPRALMAAGGVVAGSAVSGMTGTGIAEALAEALGGNGGRRLAVCLNNRLKGYLQAGGLLSHQDLHRLVGRTLAMVISATAEQSNQAVVRAERFALAELAVSIDEPFVQLASEAVGSGDSSLLASYSHVDESGPAPGPATSEPLDRKEWLPILQALRDRKGGTVSDKCLRVIADKLQRQFPQAALGALKYGGEEFAGVRLVGFRALLEQFPAALQDVASGPSGHELETIGRSFVAWSRDLASRLLSTWDPSVRKRLSIECEALEFAVGQLDEELAAVLNGNGRAIPVGPIDDSMMLTGIGHAWLTPEARRLAELACAAARGECVPSGCVHPLLVGELDELQQILERQVEQTSSELGGVRAELERLEEQERMLRSEPSAAASGRRDGPRPR